MNTQVTLLFAPFLSDEDNFEDALFEQQGTIAELLFWGPQLPLVNTIESSQLHPNDSWLIIEPVHLHATRDHLVLIPPKQLEIPPEEELSLRLSALESLQSFFSDEIIFTPRQWYCKSGQFETLKTYTPLQAQGRNIDIWMPKDTTIAGVARKWRQLQNEIQMIWHDHPINQARIQHGNVPINSIWIYGIGKAESFQPHPYLNQINAIYSDHPLLKNIEFLFDASIYTLENSSHQPNQHSLLDLTNCTSTSEINQHWDWGLNQLALKKIDQLHLLTHTNNTWKKHTVTMKHHPMASIWNFIKRTRIESPTLQSYLQNADWIKI